MKKILSYTSLVALLLIDLSCNNRHTDHYEIKYSSIGFTVSLPNGLQSKESYVDKHKEGEVYRNVDSAGEYISVTTQGFSDDSTVSDPKRTIKDPNYFVAVISRVNSWNLNFMAILSAKWQDTVVMYDLNRVRQKDFLELYVFGPGKDSVFYANAVLREVDKGGKKLIEIKSEDHITYTGMINKYWFMLQLFGNSRDSALLRKLWDDARFAN
jgi:hypothetical protein